MLLGLWITILTCFTKYCVILIGKGGAEIYMKKIFLSLIICLALLSPTFSSASAVAYPADSSSAAVLPSITANPLNFLNSLTNSIPSAIKGSVPAVSGINWDIFRNISFSSGDIGGALKSILVLVINLFLIVIQTVAGILKALLPFLNK